MQNKAGEETLFVSDPHLQSLTEHGWHEEAALMGKALNLCSHLRSLELILPHCEGVDEFYEESVQALYRSVFKMISRCQRSLREIALHFHDYEPLHLWKNAQCDQS